MKKVIILFCCVLILFSCNNIDKKSEHVSRQDTSYLDPNFKYIHLIPDSLRTPEQNKFLMDLQLVIIDHLKSVNNEMVFTLNEQQFVEKGFPKEYYTLIQKNLRDNNKYFKENNIKNVDSIIKESFKQFK